MKNFFVFAVFGILFLSISISEAYTHKGLGFLGSGDASYAYGLDDNASVKVVGMSRTVAGSDTDKRAFIWDESSTSKAELGILSGYSYSAAYSINNSGIVVGECWDEDKHQACAWDASAYPPNLAGPYALPKLLEWHVNTIPYDISTTGKVVGFSGTTAITRRACVWDVSNLSSITVTDLGALPGTGTETGSGYSVARGIDGNIVVGESYLYDTSSPGSAWRACYWNISDMSNISVGELGYISGGRYKYSYAYDVATVGAYIKAAGYSWNADERRGAAWEDVLSNPTNVSDLGYYNPNTGNETKTFSWAWAINSSNSIVGRNYMYKPNSGRGFWAFIWDPTNNLRLLVNLVSTWTSGTWPYLLDGHNINTAGKVIGYGFNPSYKHEAYIMVP